MKKIRFSTEKVVSPKSIKLKCTKDQNCNEEKEKGADKTASKS